MDRKEKGRNNKTYQEENKDEKKKITHGERRNERRRSREGRGRTKMEKKTKKTKTAKKKKQRKERRKAGRGDGKISTERGKKK